MILLKNYVIIFITQDILTCMGCWLCKGIYHSSTVMKLCRHEGKGGGRLAGEKQKMDSVHRFGPCRACNPAIVGDGLYDMVLVGTGF